MEKFSKWRDEETGIHPFFHPKEKLQINIIIRILQILLGIIKFPFIALVFLIYYILSRIISLLPLPQALKRPIQRTIDCIGCRSLLFLFGFYWINTSFFRMTRKALPSFAPGSNISSGDLIIANKQSYIDILYFGFRFGATFANIPYDTKGEVIPVSIFGALFESIFNVTIFSERKLIQSSSVTTLTDLLKTCKNHRGPVVIFPEGTSSNGRAILNCTNVLENLPISIDEIHVVGLKYEWTGFCPNYTLGNFIYHMLKLSGQVYNIMQVKYLTPLEIPPKGDDQEKWSIDIFNLLANTLRLKMIAIKPLQKREFLEYYKKGTQRGYVGRMQ